MRALEQRNDATPAAETDQAVLSVHGISKTFGSVAAVRELSFEAYSGEIIGLLGPNGAGKTTAMRVLSTLLRPTQGSFSLDGIPHTRSVEIRQRLGVLPESSGFPKHWRGVEYIRYYARLYRYSSSEANKVAARLLSEVERFGRAKDRIGTYSRGMRQRLGVARALVNIPRVIFLDEPTLGLDPAGQRQMLALIKDVAGRRGSTVLLGTHFLDEVEESCSRIIILNHGRVIAEGLIADIKRKAAPTSLRVRVAPDRRETALTAIEQAPGVTAAHSVDGKADVFTATFDAAWLGEHGDAGMNSAIRALTDANVPVLSFELEGGRLSDAFLALTKEDSE